ncbi:MAG: polysaccharide biosynthesis tyrosine autokinase [Pseudomonas sp.]|jgi:tyrosine-protein kinase Etk/Wzc|uniref:polysaccharide biosynthesis tyrosine autokinase n=1 Tax=unclassified Pseudomonas TaxID=196821 RepID=UPI000B406314|nr:MULTISPECIES: polysaccharide biosynthesis tyrosine autokinase [unclassified Pseudomonas]MDP9063152.1 polysaccharide biosynthesis tyrosine autokinase [Pseudomonadota bacterium]MDE1913628.1 polysaccharide biosynthesis tyrosine autokinase [Pseudomonas sp.]MDE2032238.1 polysaccharide biosynthesis tyrosine autokinase [Pseudomonas sp.]MDE2195069.1 polysaccharide biosynthesis tyrosine autokinase [Pseudomonas sp.]MDE2555121.1 polysaccharide biosynthesis tyrosine autokinase [Pseudomonas sp.]|eukprot:gene11215-13074_t
MQQTPAVTVQEDDNGEIDLLGLFGTLIDHKWLIAAVTGAFMVTGAAYAVLATPVYQANALLQVEAKKNDLLGFSDIGGMLGKESPSATEIELIQSRYVIGKTVDNLKLDIVVQPMYFPVVGEFLARRFQKANPGAIAEPLLGLDSFAWGGESLKIFKLDLPDGQLGKKLTLTVGENAHYTLVDEDDQVLAAGEAGQPFEQNGVAFQIEELRAKPGTRFRVIRNARLTSILDYQENLDVVERGKESGMIGLALESTEPDQAIKILNQIAAIYVRQNVERTSAEAAQSLAFLKEQLPEVKKDLEKAGKALNEYQTRSKSVDITLETKAILDQIVGLDTSISELKLQQAEMDRKFTRQHPAYRALLTQIGELTSKQQSLASRVESLPSTQQELLSLTRDVEVGTAIYTQLLNKSQELDVMRAGTVGNVRLIDTADVNFFKPIKPKKILIVLIATLLGGFLAVTLVLLRKALNRGLESPEAIEQLGLPVYASIPYSTLQKVEEDKITRGRGRADAGSSLLAISHPTDLAVEALRSLRTSLHFAMLEAPNNRIMISGPSPEVGKTFVSVNLAAVIAQTGQRVLLIDVDMRRGYLHKVLGVPAKDGLSDILSNQCTLESAIHKTGVENLDIISRGQIPPNPSELLMHRNLTELLAQVSERYDLVILDTPPLLAVTDAAIVGRQSGTNLIVTRYGLNPAKEIEHTMRRFAQNGIVLRGAIFNGVEKKASAKYGYGNYGYYQYEYQADRS